MTRRIIAVVVAFAAFAVPATASATSVKSAKASARALTSNAAVMESLFQVPGSAPSLRPGATVNDPAVESAKGRVISCARASKKVVGCAIAVSGYDASGKVIQVIALNVRVAKTSTTIEGDSSNPTRFAVK